MSAIDVFGGKQHITVYNVRLQIIDKIVGGVPSSPSVVKGWLKTRLELGDKDLQELVDQVLIDRFPDRQPGVDELADAVIAAGADINVNGFKRLRDSGGLAYEGRCMKAAIKEWANSAYPGKEWPGKSKVASGFGKGLMNTLAERVFIPEALIGLGVKEPAGTEERIKHFKDRTGRPMSAINTVEYVERPVLEFTVRVHDDFLPMEGWARIWQRGEDIGIGSDRARSDGRFELLDFEQQKTKR